MLSLPRFHCQSAPDQPAAVGGLFVICKFQFTVCFSRSCPRTKVGSNKAYNGSANGSDGCSSFFSPAKFTFCAKSLTVILPFFFFFCNITSEKFLEKFWSIVNNLLCVIVVIF